MKMVAVQSIKFLRLKRRLRLPSWQVVGVLESVWLFTQANAPAGDIGRHSDEDIAAHLEWDGDASDLIAALVECGWLDRHEAHRLVVHDWHEHAPNYLKGNMAKWGKGFATVEAADSAKQIAKQPAEDVAKQAAKQTAQASCSTQSSNDHPRVGLSGDITQAPETTQTLDTINSSAAAKAATKRFVPPSVEEVKAYCESQGYDMDAERFVDHYTSNGWRVGGKTAMKDWQASVRNWMKSPFRVSTGNYKRSAPDELPF